MTNTRIIVKAWRKEFQARARNPAGPTLERQTGKEKDKAEPKLGALELIRAKYPHSHIAEIFLFIDGILESFSLLSSFAKACGILSNPWPLPDRADS